MTDILEIAKEYDKKLMKGGIDEVKQFFTDDVVYEIAGEPPIGGVFKGREAVISSFRNREFGLGPGFESGNAERNWYVDAKSNKVVAEIHEKSWLPHAKDDVLDVRTCVILTFRGNKISHMRDYADTEAYFKFKERHPELEKFKNEKKMKLSVVSVPAQNMSKSLEFFRNALGLKTKIENPNWTEFLLDNSVIAVHPNKGNGKDLGFALQVNNIESLIGELKNSNVEFVQELQKEEWGKFAVIKDPDGTGIEIVEY